MDMVDILTRDGAPTGRVAWSNELAAGDYVRHAVIILRDRLDRYVLQQRSLKARYFPGRWDVTGGGVQAGESPEAAAAREAEEELGLKLDSSAFTFLYRYRADYGNGRGAHIFMYGVTVEPIKALPQWDTYEVNDVRLCAFDEFYLEVMYNKDEGFGEALRRFNACRA